MPESEESVAVKTYVPPAQKETWQEEAAELGMSQAEFVRTMVQAGRRDFEWEAVAGPSATPDPGGERLEERIAAAIESEGPLEYSDLLEQTEEWVADALNSLQERSAITHNPREGGYEVTDS